MVKCASIIIPKWSVDNGKNSIKNFVRSNVVHTASERGGKYKNVFEKDLYTLSPVFVGEKGELMASVLGNALRFLGDIGIYDVVLPFILTFTIVFAILEKTKVFGTEKIGAVDWPRKNINALVAFAIGFLVIASAQLVEILTRVSAQFVVLLLLIVFFLTLVGTFYTAKNREVVPEGWQTFFVFFMFIGIVFIFLAAIKTSAGKSWLQVVLDYINQFWTSTAVASIILIIVIFFIVWWVVTPEDKKGTASGSGSSGGG